MASGWVLDLPGASVTIALSPEKSRGFSGEGGVLHGLAGAEVADDADLLSALLAFEPRIDVARLAADAALTRFYAAYLDRVAHLASAVRPDLAPQAARDCAVLIVALIEGLSILRGADREAVLAPRARTQVHAAVASLILSVENTNR